MPTWPASLPQSVLQEGFQEGAPDTLIRQQMGAGPAEVRRRTTAAPTPLQASVVCTTAQLATLRSFIATDLKGGALAFDWQHPVTGASASFRFTDMPTYLPRGVNFAVRMRLEILP